jgi:catechol 2,3-dioxygenase-like lactoylglutathione lyase family enzyme
MNYIGTLIAVKDVAASRQFYQDILGQIIAADLGANVVFEGGFALQDLHYWADFIDDKTENIQFNHLASELIFEEKDFDKFVERLKEYDGIEYVHDVKEFPWGQRVIRFYDLDRHIIEVGEMMSSVCRRFIDSGMTIEEVAALMYAPVEYVKNCLREEG